MSEAHPAPDHDPVHDADFLRRVVDAASDGIIVHRAIRDDCGGIADFEMVFMNRMMETMFPAGTGSWLGRRLREDLPTTLGDGRYQLLVDVVESQQPIAREVEVHLLRGTTHRLHLSGIPMGDQVVVSLRDVTAERTATHALAESERRYRELVEHQAELVCRFLPDTTILFANEAFARYYGGSPEGLVGVRMIDLLPEPRRAPAAQVIGSLTPERPTITDEGFLIDPNGNQRWQQWTTSAVVEGDQVVEIQAVGIDITDRKRAEEAIRVRSEVLALVSQVSQRFIDLPADRVDDAVEAALADLGRAVAVDRAYLTLYQSDGVHLDMTHEWCAPGVDAARPYAVGVPDHEWPAARDAFRRGETIRIESVADMGDDWAAERESYATTGVQATLMMPLFDGGRLMGSVGFDACDRPRDWSDHEVALLGSATVSIGQVLARRDAELELRRSERRFRALVAGIPDLLIRVDANGTVLDWRPPTDLDDHDTPATVAERATRYRAPTPAAVIGRPLAEVYPELAGTIDAALVGEEAQPSQTVAFQVPSGTETASFEARVTRAGQEVIAVVRDVTTEHELQTTLLHQATHDALTGLANRRLFSEHLADALDHGHRSGAYPAVLFVDLDRFKVLNDSQGHDVGDTTLCAVAERLADSVRPGDVVARLGGDEFAVLSHRMGSESDAVTLGARVVDATGEPVLVDDQEVVITASVGVVLAAAESTVASVLRDADAAMYEAKARGRRRVELFTDDIREAALVRHQVEHDLRRALDSDQLRLRYQPLWSLVERRWAGAEALIRWEHPERGLLTPDEFLPIAEDAGLMPRLGSWVVHQACADARRWLAEDHPGVRAWVNLAADQLMAADLVETVTAALDAHGLDASAIGVEVTETAVVGDISLARANLAGLRAIGVLVALDDFGTGLSSLTHLGSLPLDVVKLDGAFVSGVTGQGRQRDLVDGIVSLVKRLGLEVLAERVETHSDAEALDALGVDSLQGYYLGRPMPASDLVEFLPRQGCPDTRAENSA